MSPERPKNAPHSSHWGAFTVSHGERGVTLRPYPEGATASPLLGNIPAAVNHPSRVTRPLVRRGWLERGPGPDPRRGSEEFVSVSWENALDLVVAEIRRVRAAHSNEAIFGGSYGWSSAGRFHHAQSQVHRFLNLCAGGYVRSVNDYSSGAALVLLPHILTPQEELTRRSLTWPDILENAELILAFGGVPTRNTDVGGGGSSEHVTAPSLREAERRGIRIVSISPLKDDTQALANVEWRPIVPSTDTALMLALAYVLESEGLCDREFLDRYCTGYEEFRNYLVGASDGCAKSPSWAAGICGIAPAQIAALARDMARCRTVVSVTYSLQRTQRGEQPLWAGLALAAMLGRIGLRGLGFSFGLGSSGNTGKPPLRVNAPALWQGVNPIKTFIPVSRIADMLLHPGESYDYNGQALRYPDIRLLYWAGGNPFHHHQDLQRLARAFAKPDTIVLHDPFFTSTARFADIVLPSTITLEREDIGASRNDPIVMAMHKVTEPLGEARDDYWMFAEMAKRLGACEAFTEGRTARQWLEHLYEQLRADLARETGHAPDFHTFWQAGSLTLPIADAPGVIERFRSDPVRHPLKTRSGKIEITSGAIKSFGYADCLGHPAWLEHDEWRGSTRGERFPLQLIANQPATRLHSQLDFGACSAKSKVAGREPARIHPTDAAKRGIKDGQVVRLFNDRGSCLAGAIVSEAVMPGVVQLSTGAWYQPVNLPGIGVTCIHGNPNILTKDSGTSRLAQACSGQLTLVELEAFTGDPPPVTAHAAPDAPPADAESVALRLRQLRAAASTADG